METFFFPFALFLACMGWTSSIVEGVPVWIHSSGLVVYKQ